jgi:stearoyl-CoA desaturase (delta-9 desaturase)
MLYSFYWLDNVLVVVGFLLSNFLISGLGMSVGFHRYFTHKSFKTNRFWHYAMMYMGSLACQGSLLFWVALHRQHHPNSDTGTDTHSPTKGFWHAYMGWVFKLEPENVKLSSAQDLLRDTGVRFLHRKYKYVLWVTWVVAALVTEVWPLTSGLVCGFYLASCWAIHQEALINSVCHSTWAGTAPYAAKTKDNSRNVPWLHWITWGQSLHNNHHAFAASSNFGDPAKNEKDTGYKFIISFIQQRTTAVKNKVPPSSVA